MSAAEQIIIDEIKAIPDPEIPVITIEELGILKHISIEDNTLHVTITPIPGARLCSILKVISKILRKNIS